MATKLVEMAQRDPKTGKITMGVEEVEIVTATIRNRDLARSGGHVFNSLVCGAVKFAPGETKTLEISEPEAAEIKRNRNGAWELTSAAPILSTPADDDDEEAPEPTSSEASAMAMAEPPRVQHRTKR